MHRVADERDRMACVSGDELDGDQRKRRNYRHAQRQSHTFGGKRDVRVSAQSVAVTMVMTSVRMMRAAVRVVVHQWDFNRDSPRAQRGFAPTPQRVSAQSLAANFVSEMNAPEETQLTYSPHPPTMAQFRGFKSHRERGGEHPDSPGDDAPSCQAGVLGSARLDADARARYLALRR